MDEELMKEVITNADFDKLMTSMKSIQDLGEGIKIIEYFKEKGYNVKKYQERINYKLGVIDAINKSHNNKN